ncbi:MAG: hypothetical protein J6T13_07475 [Bacteroidales bacterium]|nr:hypothetical protein [Bacteroidales bacterium]
MKKLPIPFLMLLLSVTLLSCYTYHTEVSRSQIKDIIYVTSEGSGSAVTQAYFLLENGEIVPLPINFNPSTPESYIGKTHIYEHLVKGDAEVTNTTSLTQRNIYEYFVEGEESQTRNQSMDQQPQNQSAVTYKPEDYSEYICQKKYISDGKYYLRVFTDKNHAIKTIQVSAEVYHRVQERSYVLKMDIEKYIKKKE